MVKKSHLRHLAPSPRFAMVIAQEPTQSLAAFAQILLDKCAYPKGTAGHCPSLGDFAQRGNARHIRSAPVAARAHRREPPWTGTPPSPTGPSAPHRHSSSGCAQAARAVRLALMRSCRAVPGPHLVPASSSDADVWSFIERNMRRKTTLELQLSESTARSPHSTAGGSSKD